MTISNTILKAVCSNACPALSWIENFLNPHQGTNFLPFCSNAISIVDVRRPEIDLFIVFEQDFLENSPLGIVKLPKLIHDFQLRAPSFSVDSVLTVHSEPPCVLFLDSHQILGQLLSTWGFGQCTNYWYTSINDRKIFKTFVSDLRSFFVSYFLEMLQRILRFVDCPKIGG